MAASPEQPLTELLEALRVAVTGKQFDRRTEPWIVIGLAATARPLVEQLLATDFLNAVQLFGVAHVLLTESIPTAAVVPNAAEQECVYEGPVMKRCMDETVHTIMDHYNKNFTLNPDEVRSIDASLIALATGDLIFRHGATLATGAILQLERTRSAESPVHLGAALAALILTADIVWCTYILDTDIRPTFLTREGQLRLAARAGTAQHGDVTTTATAAAAAAAAIMGTQNVCPDTHSDQGDDPSDAAAGVLAHLVTPSAASNSPTSSESGGSPSGRVPPASALLQSWTTTLQGSTQRGQTAFARAPRAGAPPPSGGRIPPIVPTDFARPGSQSDQANAADLGGSRHMPTDSNTAPAANHQSVQDNRGANAANAVTVNANHSHVTIHPPGHSRPSRVKNRPQSRRGPSRGASPAQPTSPRMSPGGPAGKGLHRRGATTTAAPAPSSGGRAQHSALQDPGERVRRARAVTPSI